MTTEAVKARDEQLIAAMTVTLTSGYAIENARGDARLECVGPQFSVLKLERQEGIVGATPLRPVREMFDDVREAVRYYLDACDDS
jgi:hypothetical protein